MVLISLTNFRLGLLRIANRQNDFIAKQLDAQNFDFQVEIREDAFELPSSFIGIVTWFEDETMTISISGKIFNYCNVSRQMFVRFRNAGSKGRFFNNNIRSIKECRN